MQWLLLCANSILLGVGLAIDAFSVSVADAISEPGMKKSKRLSIALTFALYQIAMPLIGWVCVHTIASVFTSFQAFIPYIALALLLYIGGKMVAEAVRGEEDGEEEENAAGILTFSALMLQGIATSIDALSVGFAIADYTALEAILSSLIIGVVTYIICIFGLALGKKVGALFEKKATLFGGIVLMLLGVEIFVKGVFFGG